MERGKKGKNFVKGKEIGVKGKGKTKGKEIGENGFGISIGNVNLGNINDLDDDAMAQLNE